MRRFICVLVMSMLFVSCANKRYGHYTYIKKDKARLSSTVNKKKVLKTKSGVVAQKETSFVISGGDNEINPVSFDSHENTASTPVTKTIRENANTDKILVKERENEVQRSLPAQPTKEYNRNAKRGIKTLLFGIGIFYVPFLGWVLSVIMIVKALKLGLKAIEEIDAEPQKYKGMGLASVTVLFSIIIIASLIALALLGIAYLLTEGIIGYSMFWIL